MKRGGDSHRSAPSGVPCALLSLTPHCRVATPLYPENHPFQAHDDEAAARQGPLHYAAHLPWITKLPCVMMAVSVRMVSGRRGAAVQCHRDTLTYAAPRPGLLDMDGRAALHDGGCGARRLFALACSCAPTFDPGTLLTSSHAATYRPGGEGQPPYQHTRGPC